MAAGLDSVAATEFATTLTERFDTEFPQTLLFDHPTIESVAEFISETTVCENDFEGDRLEVISEAQTQAIRSLTPNRVTSLSNVFSFALPGRLCTCLGLTHVVLHGLATNSSVPGSRWETTGIASNASATYGSFILISSDPAAFGISKMEA